MTSKSMPRDSSALAYAAMGPLPVPETVDFSPRKATVAAPQLVTVGGTAELVAQLEALEGVEVVHVEDGGTRGQALAVLAAVWLLMAKLPTSFLPDEDQGAIMTIVQAPSGTTAVPWWSPTGPTAPPSPPATP